jgi:hypothetical protein
MSLAKTHPHEFAANIIFAADDLGPYWAARSRIRDLDGGEDDLGTFLHNAREYSVSLGYQNSGLAPRPEDDIEEVHEYRLHIHQIGAPERKADFLIQPRWANMRTEDGKTVSTPDLLGVNVKTQGANIEFAEYVELLRKAANVAGIRGTYFNADKIHPYSNVYDAARYVRVRRSKSGKVYGVNGTLRRIRELVSEEGYSKLVSDDREINGYYHTATFDSDGARELLDQRYAKEIKHYHPENPRSDDSDPLYHPKVEASYQNSKDDFTVKMNDLEGLSRELDATVLNVLSWSDLPTSDDGYHLIDDHYHENENVKRNRQIIKDPTPQLRDEQNARVIQHLRGINESDYEVMRELVSDGGEVSTKELEDRTGRDISTIYRALDRMDDLVHNDNGAVSVASSYMKERLNDAIQNAEEQLENALELSAEVVETATDELERRGGALREWITTYGVDIEDREDDRMEMKIGKENGRDIKKILREGRKAWKRAGREERRFLTAEVKTWNDTHDAWHYGKARGFLGVRHRR